MLAVTTWLTAGCQIYSERSKPDLKPYSDQPVLFLAGAAPDEFSKEFWNSLVAEVEEALRKHPLLGRIDGKALQESRVSRDAQLQLDLQQYQTLLTLTGISEKSLAARLALELEVRQVLLFQFIIFPCTKECTSPEHWVLRVQMLEMMSGEPIHRVRISYQPSSGEMSGEARESRVRALTADLMGRFGDSFIIPWHRLRYENLKPGAHVVSVEAAEKAQ